MSTTFSPGDVVRLRSGGPAMTVTSASAPGVEVGCQWWYGGQYNGQSFPAVALIKLDAADSPPDADAAT